MGQKIIGKHQLTQIVQEDGTALESNENPDFFLSGKSIYAPAHEGNKVELFTCGEDYFDRVGEAIDSAQQCVFITGWQINYDINLRKVNTERTEKLIATRDKLQDKYDEHDARINTHIQSKVNEPSDFSSELFVTFDTSIIRSLQKQIDALNEKIVDSRKEQTLWHCLRSAVLRGVKVYVLPWSCPPVGPMVTYDIETMCAIFQLNIGLTDKSGNHDPVPRAFFMFANTKSDMGASNGNGSATVGGIFNSLGNLFFSQHQKSVIIDNKIGFLGGIDLAYGRRDDASFSLNCSERFGNDRYNPCIPPIESSLKSQHVSRVALLLSTLFEISAPARTYNSVMGVVDVAKQISDWWKSPCSWKIAYAFRNLTHSVNKKMEDFQRWALESFFDPVLGWVMRLGIELTLVIIEVYKHKIDGYLTKIQSKIKGDGVAAIERALSVAHREEMIKLENYIELLPAIRDWFMNTKEGQLFSIVMDQDISFMMPNKAEDAGNFFEALIAQILTTIQLRASDPGREVYEYIANKPQPLLPRGGLLLNHRVQPRMPWHDVQMGNQGPAVYDLSRNFIDRWNASQVFMERSSKKTVYDYAELFEGLLIFIQAVFENPRKLQDAAKLVPLVSGYVQAIKTGAAEFGKAFVSATPKPNYISDELLPDEPKKTEHKGEDTVQIIRSTPVSMLKYEAKGRDMSGVYLDAYFSSRKTLSKQTITHQLFDHYEKQTDCLEAWIKAIQGSQRFIYIESQYVQSNFGEPYGYYGAGITVDYNSDSSTPSGPMGELVYFDSDVLPLIRRMGADEALNTMDITKIKLAEFKQIIFELSGKVEDRDTGKKQPRPRLLLKLKDQLTSVWKTQFMGKLTRQMFVEDAKRPQKNAIIEELALRIHKAICVKETFHVYIVMPVHPEGMLNDPSTMHTIHLSMQTLYNGKDSLVKRIQKDMCTRRLMEEEGLNYDMARAKALAPKNANSTSRGYDGNEQISGTNVDPLFLDEDWTQYLTLLNLRNWDRLDCGFLKGWRVVTEQIYVHSKLMIVDDRVAIIGSCNLNDRSMDGARDTELAAIVHGGVQRKVALNGVDQDSVSETVYNFRVKLWRKLFALDAKESKVAPATTLASVLDKPAAPETYRAIQKRAKDNTDAYNEVFNFIPQNASPVQHQVQLQPFNGKFPNPEEDYYPLGCSIWPTWAYTNPDNHKEKGELKGKMPFEEEFWTAALDNYKAPKDIQGFIVELPVQWTMGESNISYMADTLLAQIDHQLQQMGENPKGLNGYNRHQTAYAYSEVKPSSPTDILTNPAKNA